MKTFQSSYCARHRCSPAAFSRRVLIQSMPALVKPVAAVIAMFSQKPFEQDLRLIQYCGEATTMRKVRDEIGGHFSEASYWGFWRRRLHFRISTAKLKAIAGEELEEPPRWRTISANAEDQEAVLPTP